MKLKLSLICTASLLLVLTHWLAFHDIHESHTVRDWLVLLASGLVLLQFGLELLPVRRQDHRGTRA